MAWRSFLVFRDKTYPAGVSGLGFVGKVAADEERKVPKEIERRFGGGLYRVVCLGPNGRALKVVIDGKTHMYTNVLDLHSQSTPVEGAG